ncbi:arsenite methyltransferase [Verrucomicrobiota bacterium]
MKACCNSEKAEQIRDSVREAYSSIATKGGSCCATSSSCCGSSSAEDLAKEIGYSDEELAALPDGANMGLSCGNPTALASLKPGEVVLDLGSGGGFDVFIAARKVGPTGQAIGIDMTPEMISKARRNELSFRKQTGLANVEFRLGEIEHLPAADKSVDVVISNCVINLSPDKSQVWREIARVLKPRGRAAVSDIALLRPLPEAIRESIVALAGCVAGAVLVSETEAMIKAAGLTDITVTAKPDYIDSMTEWNDPLGQEIRKHLPEGAKMSDYVTSLYVSCLAGKEEEEER